MLRKLRFRPPKFSIASLMLAMAGVAMGFAVSQAPSIAPDADFAMLYIYSPDRRWVHGLQSTAAIWMVLVVGTVCLKRDRIFCAPLLTLPKYVH